MKVRTVSRKDTVETMLTTERVREPVVGKYSSHSFEEKVADSRVYIRNIGWPRAQEDFINEPWMRACAHYFPNSFVGPIFMDRPKDKDALKACQRKAEALSRRGHLYLIITKDMTLDQAKEEAIRCRGLMQSQN